MYLVHQKKPKHDKVSMSCGCYYKSNSGYQNNKFIRTDRFFVLENSFWGSSTACNCKQNENDCPDRLCCSELCQSVLKSRIQRLQLYLVI